VRALLTDAGGEVDLATLTVPDTAPFTDVKDAVRAIHERRNAGGAAPTNSDILDARYFREIGHPEFRRQFEEQCALRDELIAGRGDT